jgi:hypothetical protein
MSIHPPRWNDRAECESFSCAFVLYALIVRWNDAAELGMG